MNSSPISNCWCLKSAILFSHNINYYNIINSLLRLRVGTHIIYIYYNIIFFSIYNILDEHNILEDEMKTIRRQPLTSNVYCFYLAM